MVISNFETLKGKWVELSFWCQVFVGVLFGVRVAGPEQ